MSVLEDLIAKASGTYTPELRTALAAPRDEDETAKVQDRLGDVAKAAGVDEEQIADVAVRGSHRAGLNVTFVVVDEDGRTSKGFVPLADLGKKRASSTAVVPNPPVDSIDDLKGDDLEKAGADAGHPGLGEKPWSELKADEKRAALKKHREQP